MSAEKSKSVINQVDDPAAERAREIDPVDKPDAKNPQSGSIKFDDRGNAIWEWSVATSAFARDPVADRLKRLENPALSIAHDSPTPYDIARPNPLGTVKGYNPYDSGKLDKAAAVQPKKKDLRKLSEWMKLKKQHQENKDNDDKDEL